MRSPLHDDRSALQPRHLRSWLFLAGAAGAVNAIAFLACQRFVTHVTGTVTRIGLDSGQWALMAEYAVVLLCFIAGAAAAPLLVRASPPRLGHALPPALTVIVLCGVALAGMRGAFGPFDGEVESLGSFALLSLLALAMGLQNAAVASATPLGLRTTHMTGPASDLGVHLATALSSRGAPQRTALQLAALRGGKLLAFILGAAVAVPLARAFGYGAFLVPAALIAIAARRSLVHPQAGENRALEDLGHRRPRAAA